MNPVTILVLLGVISLVVVIIINGVQNFRARKFGCSCGCDSCGDCGTPCESCVPAEEEAPAEEPPADDGADRPEDPTSEEE